MKTDIKKQDNHLSFEEFEILWRIKAREYGERNSVIFYSQHLLLFIHNYLEYFFLHHLSLSKEDCIAFGFKNDLEAAVNTVSKFTIQESLIFVAANYAMTFEQELMREAYSIAMKLYEKYSKEPSLIKNKIIFKYMNNFKKYGSQIHSLFSDEAIASRMFTIGMKFNFTDKEFDYIHKNLNEDMNSSIVIKLENLYKLDIKQKKDLNL